MINLPLFVYGTLLERGRNHSRLENSLLIGKAITGPYYDLYSWETDGGYLAPALIEGRNHVEGELYQIEPHLWDLLDLCEGHPWLYRREPIQIRLLDEKGSVVGMPVSAVTYVYVSDRNGFRTDQIRARGNLVLSFAVTPEDYPPLQKQTA